MISKVSISGFGKIISHHLQPGMEPSCVVLLSPSLADSHFFKNAEERSIAPCRPGIEVESPPKDPNSTKIPY